MPRDKPGQASNQASKKKNEEENNQEKPQTAQTPHEENVNVQTSDVSEFLSGDQVLWFRNIIRAQGKDILKEMMDEKWRKLQVENEALKQWVKSENEELVKKITELQEDNREKQKRIERLEYENRQKVKVIEELNTKYDELEQSRYVKDVQLVGLPESNNEEEDLKKILKMSKDKLGIKLKGIDIEGFHRLGKKTEKRSRDMVITFKEKKTREAFHEQRKKTSQSKDVTQNIYINDHLTDFRKGLFYRARQLVKHKKLFMAWTQKGNVLIRKEEGGKVIQVNSYRDMNSLIEDTEHLLNEYSSSEVSSYNQGDMMSHISDYEY